MSDPSNECAVSDLCDSKKAVARDWPLFTEKLTSVLSKLEEDQYLIVSAKTGNRFVQFACQGAWGMRVEVTSNHFLESEDRLNRRQMSWLRSHGWNAPTGKLNKATPAKDPNGSPNYYIDFPAPVNAGGVAHIAIETLVNGLETSHPSSLVYKAFAVDGKAFSFNELGLKTADIEDKPLMEKVLEVFRAVTGIADLERDEDGDVMIRYRSIAVCATPLENKLRLSTALITDTVESPTLLCKLNQLNFGPQGIRCVHHEKTVFAAFDMPANPFVPEHLAEEMKEFTAVAEGFALVLRAEFSRDSSARTGGTANYIQ